MTARWMDIQNMPPTPARVWLYGPPRSGKTICAAYFPRPFWIYPHNENSVTSLRGMQHVRGAVEVGSDPTSVRADLTGVLATLLDADQAGTLQERFGETIVVDGFTHLNDLVLNELAISDMKGGKNATGMNEQKWGLYLAYLLYLRDTLFRLRAHVVFISLAQTTIGKHNGGTLGPYVQGKGGMLLPASCDLMTFCEAQVHPRAYLAHCEAFGGYDAGPRLGMGFQPCTVPSHQLWSTIAPFFGHR